MKAKNIALLLFLSILLVGCITSIDKRLPYRKLPEIKVATRTRLLASPAHGESYLSESYIPAGGRVKVIGTDENAAWLLVLHGKTLGWMPSILSRTNIATLKPAVVFDPLSEVCTKFVKTTATQNEVFTSKHSGSALILGSIYRPQVTKSFKDATLTLSIRGAGRIVESEYVNMPLTPSTGAVLFAYSVDDLGSGSRLSFRLNNPNSESIFFQSAYFINDCPTQESPVAGSLNRLPIGRYKTDIPKQLPAPRRTTPAPTPTRYPARSSTKLRPTLLPTIDISSGDAAGIITADVLNIRSGPGIEYTSISAFKFGDNVLIIGQNRDRNGNTWWKIRRSSRTSGWVHSGYVDESGCIECVPTVAKPPVPTPRPTPTPRPRPIASNRGDLRQGQNGWTYQYEQGRPSFDFAPFVSRQSYNGIDCYISPQENYVRLCRNGELHPGQGGSVAYRWDSTYSGPASVVVYARKIDTRCGDGVWVGTYLGNKGQSPQKIGEFSIGKTDKDGRTKRYSVNLSSNSFLLVRVDIRRTAECDQSRVFIDVMPR